MDRGEFKAFEGRIFNWVAAMRFGCVAGTCGSVEKRYRPEEEDRKQEGARLLDVQDAWLLEDAWRTLLTPWAKWMIKWHYHMHIQEMGIIRQLQKKCGRGVRRDMYERELFCAVELMKKNLDMRLSRPHTRIQQFDSASSGAYGSQQAALSCPEETKPA